MNRSEVIAGLSARFCQAHGREPDSDELILALVDTVIECGRHVSPGFMRWHPGRPVPPPKIRPEPIMGEIGEGSPHG